MLNSPRLPSLIALWLCIFACMGNARADHFTDTMRSVYQNHPALQAERAALEAARQDIPEAYTGFLPNISATAERGRQTLTYNDVRQPTEITSAKGASFSQPLFNGGGTLAQIGEAKARVRAAEARLRQAEAQVLLGAINAYADLAEKQQVFDLARENVAVLTEHLDGTQKQFDAGEVTISDVSESQARLARAEAELSDATGTLATAREAYRREIGETLAATELPPLPAGLPQGEDTIAARATQAAAVQEAQNTVRAANYRIGRQMAALLPSARLEGSVRNAEGSTTPGLRSNDERSLMVRVSVPIFQTGAEYVGLQRLRHEYRRAQEQTDDVTRESRQRALAAWHDYEAATQAIGGHTRAKAAADKAYESVRTEQIAGTRTVLDVLNAHQELFATRINLIRSKTRQAVDAYAILATTDALPETILNGAATSPFPAESNQVTLPTP